MKRVGVILIVLFSFFGLADSIYLAQHEESGTPLLCNIENLSGCNTVTGSEYSRLFGISLAKYGIAFYGILFILAALEIVFYNRLLRRALQAAALVGLIASLYFTFVQMFFIGAFCIYCLASALTVLLIFICAGFIESTRGRAPEPPKERKFPAHLTMPPRA